MIPQLYEKDTTSFPSSSTQMGGTGFLGGLPDCISCDVREVLNGEYECTFQYPCNAPMYPEIKIGRIILVSHDALLSKEPFDIYAVSINIDGVATFRAHHVSYRLAKLVSLPSPFFNSNYTSGTLTRILTGNVTYKPAGYLHMNNLPYGVTFSGSVSGLPNLISSWAQSKITTVRNRLLDDTDSFRAITNCEFEWSRFSVKAWGRRGSDKPTVIRFSHNLKAMTYEYDRGDAGNQIIPYYYGPSGYDAIPNFSYAFDGNSELAEGGKIGQVTWDGFTDYMEFTGDYVSFPGSDPKNGQYYAIPVEIGSYLPARDTDLPSVEDFISAASKYCKDNNIGKPYENLTIDFEPIWQTDEYKYVANTEKLVLGDSAIVLYPEINLNKRMRVVSATWDVLLERYKQMEFGTTAQGIYTVNLNTGTEQMGDEDATIIVDDLPDIDEIPIPEDE